MVETKVVRIDEDLLPVIRKYSDGSVSDGIRAMHRLLVESGGRVVTTDEVGDVVRKITQVEGVMLHEKQRGFFREIFASLTQCISDKGPMRK